MAAVSWEPGATRFAKNSKTSPRVGMAGERAGSDGGRPRDNVPAAP